MPKMMNSRSVYSSFLFAHACSNSIRIWNIFETWSEITTAYLVSIQINRHSLGDTHECVIYFILRVRKWINIVYNKYYVRYLIIHIQSLQKFLDFAFYNKFNLWTASWAKMMISTINNLCVFSISFLRKLITVHRINPGAH